MQNSYLRRVYEDAKHKGFYVFGFFLITLSIFIGYQPYKFAISKIIGLEVKLDDLYSVSFLIGKNLHLFLIMLPFLTGCTALYFIVREVHRLPFSSLLSVRDRIDFRRILFSFSLWGFFIVLIFLIEFSLNSKDIFWNFDLVNFSILFLLSVVLIPFQVGFEECFFRGYFMHWIFSLTRSNAISLFMSSFFFGMMHFSNPEVKAFGNGIMLYYLFTGFFLGTITLMDRGLELVFGFHLANNFVTALLVTSNISVFQTDALFRDHSTPSLGGQFFIFFGLFPLILFLFSRKYAWKDWKNRLI